MFQHLAVSKHFLWIIEQKRFQVYIWIESYDNLYVQDIVMMKSNYDDYNYIVVFPMQCISVTLL